MSAVRTTLLLASGAQVALEASREGDRIELRYEGEVRSARIVPRSTGGAGGAGSRGATGECDLVFDDGSRHRIRYSRLGDARWASLGATTWSGQVERAGRRASQAEGSLASPMPGRVVSVEVAVGDAVAEGQVLVRVEAMKMEHAVRAPYAGRVTHVHCADGQQVDGGAALVALERESGAEDGV